MTAAQISIAAELACIARLSREDALNHIEARLLQEPDHRIRRELCAEYHRIFERRTAA